MTEEEQARFDAATEHPYECRCELCQEWWENVPPEDDAEGDGNEADDVAF